MIRIDMGAKDLEENLGWKAMDSVGRHGVGWLKVFRGWGVF
jgi:hypothetical protein